jgi:hypothetical protein
MPSRSTPVVGKVPEASEVLPVAVFTVEVVAPCDDPLEDPPEDDPLEDPPCDVPPGPDPPCLPWCL